MPRTDLTWETMDRLKSPLPQETANRGRRQAALRLLQSAMEGELTSRQRQCVELCVLRGLSQVEVGKMLGLNKSTVCRHLQKAKRILRRAASYAETFKGL
ncbi:MAG: sigma-70 family RNA polymerase sigma factor [Acutalibacter sp.]|jgi:RNA polymerase sigma factor (sigma-70 family)